jgi:hypothetical protein
MCAFLMEQPHSSLIVIMAPLFSESCKRKKKTRYPSLLEVFFWDYWEK